MMQELRQALGWEINSLEKAEVAFYTTRENIVLRRYQVCGPVHQVLSHWGYNSLSSQFLPFDQVVP